MAGIVISALGVMIFGLVYALVAHFVGLAEWISSLRSDPFMAIMLAWPPLAMLGLLGNAVWHHVWGDSLSLTAEGLLIRTSERRRFVAWSDIKQFRVEQPTHSLYPILGWDNHDDALGGNPVWERSGHSNEIIKTLDQDIGFGWAGGDTQVCAVLEQWRTRHST